jgi:hypothetical protein
MSELPPDDPAAAMRRRLARVLYPDGVPIVPIIGRGHVETVSSESFTTHVARALELPALNREPQESEEQYLIRRLNQLKPYNRHWAHATLECLPPDLLKLAALQICNAAADHAQDRACTRARR